LVVVEPQIAEARGIRVVARDCSRERIVVKVQNLNHGNVKHGTRQGAGQVVSGHIDELQGLERLERVRERSGELVVLKDKKD
jgi:hypothetical protein